MNSISANLRNAWHHIQKALTHRRYVSSAVMQRMLAVLATLSGLLLDVQISARAGLAAAIS